MGERLPGTALEHDRVVPGVRFVDPAGGTAVSLWGFRHRHATVLAFLHPGCRPCARFAAGLAGLEGDIRLADARAFAVVPAPAELPVSVLVDPEGSGTRRLLGPDGEVPVVLVIDRYGAAWRSFPAPGHRFPPAGEVADTVSHLALMCPECGVSTW